MIYVGIVVSFVLAMILAAQSSRLSGTSLQERLVNYLLALLSIFFAVGFAMATSWLIQGEKVSLHLLIIFSVIPGFTGVFLAQWSANTVSKINTREAGAGKR